MAVKIRLARYGRKKSPFYRIVVAQDTAPRDGRFIETIGTYDPCAEPARITIDTQKAARWLNSGARPTQSARQLLKKHGLEQA